MQPARGAGVQNPILLTAMLHHKSLGLCIDPSLKQSLLARRPHSRIHTSMRKRKEKVEGGKTYASMTRTGTTPTSCARLRHAGDVRCSEIQ